MSDLFGLEDASDFLEGWCVWASSSADFTCYMKYFTIIIVLYYLYFVVLFCWNMETKCYIALF